MSSKPILQLTNSDTAEYSSDAIVNDLDIMNDLKINSTLPSANQVLGTSTSNVLSWQIPFPVICQYQMTQYQNINASSGRIITLDSGTIFNRGCEGVYTQVDSVNDNILFLQNCTVRVQVVLNCWTDAGDKPKLQIYALKNGDWTYGVYLEYSTVCMDFIQSFVAGDTLSLQSVRTSGIITTSVAVGDQDYITITVIG